MNKLKTSIIIFIFAAQCLNVFGQTIKYPFNVQKSGQGKQAIIFIPGFASSGEVWNESIEKFKDTYTCYSLTMSGFAGVQPQNNSSFKNWTISISKFIQDNKIEKPIIVGHSMGGGLALAIASEYPDLIDKIIVVDALPCMMALTNPSFKSKENNDCSASVNLITAMPEEQFYQMQKQSIPQLVADTTIQEKIVSWSVKSDRKTFAEMYCDFSNTDLREKIQNIKCQSLILLQSYFTFVKPAINEQYKNLKTANLQYATKGLHFIMYDDKDCYFTQINNFLVKQ